MNILMCTDEEFAPSTATALKSFYAFNDAAETQVFILHPGLTHPTQNKIKSSVNELKNIHFINISNEPFSSLGLPSLNGQYSPYFRLLAAEQLPQSVNKIIYLDSDILVLKDLHPIWDAPCDENYLLATADGISAQLNEHRDILLKSIKNQSIELKPVYFNTGVMILNLELWRKNHFLEQLLALAKSGSQLFKYFDQDLLNIAVGIQWGELPRNWNVQTVDFFTNESRSSHPNFLQYRETIYHPGIVHFTSPAHKPWVKSCRNPYKKVFLHFLKQTQFSDWEKVEKPTLKAKLIELVNSIKDQIRQRVWKKSEFQQHLTLNFMK